MSILLPSPLQKVKWDYLKQFDVELFMKRDDLIHSAISGNKWRKLKLNIEKFKQGNYDLMLTFGGAYSNHIAATAFAGGLLDIPTIGMIRGEELTQNSNTTLKAAAENGMKLIFETREKYKERHERIFWEELRVRFGNILIVPEGGANFLGMLGCAELMAELPFEPDYVLTAAGTGTTAAGLLYNATDTKIIAVSALKSGHFLRNDIKEQFYYAGMSNNEITEKLNLLELETDCHFGGYGKNTPELIDFMNQFYSETGLALDHVYTAKMMFALKNRLTKRYFKKGAKIVAVHTGGLQGNKSIASQLIF